MEIATAMAHRLKRLADAALHSGNRQSYILKRSGRRQNGVTPARHGRGTVGARCLPTVCTMACKVVFHGPSWALAPPSKRVCRPQPPPRPPRTYVLKQSVGIPRPTPARIEKRRRGRRSRTRAPRHLQGRRVLPPSPPPSRGPLAPGKEHHTPGTRPNTSESHSEISTRVPFCIAPWLARARRRA